MAFYQSEQVINFLTKALADGKVTAYESGEAQQFSSNVDGLILPNGDLYDRGQRFYARIQVEAPAVKKEEAPVEVKKEEAPVEQPPVETPAPKPARKTAAKAAK